MEHAVDTRRGDDAHRYGQRLPQVRLSIIRFIFLLLDGHFIRSVFLLLDGHFIRSVFLLLDGHLIDTHVAEMMRIAMGKGYHRS